MKIFYRDDYEVDIHTHESDSVPRVGESVSFVHEDWYVKKVTWLVEEEAVVVSLTQVIIREAKSNGVNETIADLKRTVSAVVQTQQKQEKKTRQLNEQIAIIRQGVNQRIYNERKT